MCSERHLIPSEAGGLIGLPRLPEVYVSILRARILVMVKEECFNSARLVEIENVLMNVIDIIIDVI